jgi:nucleoside-diphosphate kinase
MKERTLIVIKPDGMRHEKKIISHYEKHGLKIISKKTLKIDKKVAEKHYPASDEQIIGMGNKTITASKENRIYDKVMELFGTEDPRMIGLKLREWLIKFITSAPVTAVILEGEDAITLTRKITGFTDPSSADKETVRGSLGTDSIAKANSEGRPVMNLVHASGSKREAENEISLWFPELKKPLNL